MKKPSASDHHSDDDTDDDVAPDEEDDDGEPRVLLTRKETLRIRAPWRESLIIQLFGKPLITSGDQRAVSTLLIMGLVSTSRPFITRRIETVLSETSPGSSTTDSSLFVFGSQILNHPKPPFLLLLSG
ncbi:hypothetical protein CRG98_036795 [Punica granatum]|uniref:Uncharacterized protein n=1 Tax=Punica granatum TaxID=22663 RepID=A0A2I0IHM2_PUNGR|nr:hypothetical protein CRG98_036795 [Punica granatum]